MKRSLILILTTLISITAVQAQIVSGKEVHARQSLTLNGNKVTGISNDTSRAQRRPTHLVTELAMKNYADSGKFPFKLGYLLVPLGDTGVAVDSAELAGLIAAGGGVTIYNGDGNIIDQNRTINFYGSLGNTRRFQIRTPDKESGFWIDSDGTNAVDEAVLGSPLAGGFKYDGISMALKIGSIGVLGIDSTPVYITSKLKNDENYKDSALVIDSNGLIKKRGVSGGSGITTGNLTDSLNGRELRYKFRNDSIGNAGYTTLFQHNKTRDSLMSVVNTRLLISSLSDSLNTRESRYKFRNDSIGNAGYTTLFQLNKSKDSVQANIDLKANIANPTFTGVVAMANGTNSAPSLHFGDANTGFYRSASNTINLTFSGTNRFAITTTSIASVSTGGALITQASGSASAPQHSFAADANAGMYRSAADNVGLSTNGISALHIDDAQRVGIGTSTPTSSAILDVTSTTGGVKFPNMTTTQRDAITSPAHGLVIFNTTADKLQVRTSSAWVDLH